VLETGYEGLEIGNLRVCHNEARSGSFRLAGMNDAPLTYSSSEAGRPGLVVMKLTGPLTLRNMFEFQNELATNKPPRMVFDLSGVPYMDSAGIGILINYYVSAEKNSRRMALAGANERVGALLELTKVQNLLRSFATTEEAVEHV
jgi:anti-anti-sigma factor